MTARDMLDNFLDAKYSIYLEVGSMEDINNMDIVDFERLNQYIRKRNRMIKGEPIPLKDSNKEMIRRAKEKKKNG